MNGELVVFHLHRTDEQNCIKYWHGWVVDTASDLSGRNDLLNAARQNKLPIPK